MNCDLTASVLRRLVSNLAFNFLQATPSPVPPRQMKTPGRDTLPAKGGGKQAPITFSPRGVRGLCDHQRTSESGQPCSRLGATRAFIRMSHIATFNVAPQELLRLLTTGSSCCYNKREGETGSKKRCRTPLQTQSQCHVALWHTHPCVLEGQSASRGQTSSITSTPPTIRKLIGSWQADCHDRTGVMFGVFR